MVLDYIPDGMLPKWMLIVSTAAFFNSAQCFISPFKFNREIYSLQTSEVTCLSARLFGVWTLLSGIVRLHCTYNIHDRTAYIMAMATYAIALFHFSTELLIFKTVKLNRASLGPFIVSTFSLTWMIISYSKYVS
ncbi:ergosterol biosynthesis protein [Entomophthora muscae]|uniref:Ergosterol biosynthesis protein n=1 Tax=Entomophthora muscae TaxID=34485 RepID=A0ACC2UHX7_9FUNG|nr:ergosterol biosynthesis protein [Entomophthora muscae]